MVERMSPPATAAGALRLQIGILNFGQRILPIVSRGQPAGCRSTYGNGSWGNTLRRDGFAGVRAGGAGWDWQGTGSNPPREKGWQRKSLQAASAQPRSGPCVAMAMAAYSEQVGRNLQPPGCSECSAGESQRCKRRAVRARCASWCGRPRAADLRQFRHACRLGQLFLGLLKDTHNLRSSCANSMVSTTRRGCRMRSKPAGKRSTWRRSASRMRRLTRLRSWALPITLPTVRPTRAAAGAAAPSIVCGARNQLMAADWRLRAAA